jgi:hypothetical protein
MLPVRPRQRSFSGVTVAREQGGIQGTTHEQAQESLADGLHRAVQIERSRRVGREATGGDVKPEPSAEVRELGP